MSKSTKTAVAEEIELLMTAIETCKKGQLEGDEDGEWATMQQCYEEGLAALRRIEDTIAKQSTLTVALEGGLVSAVCSHDPNLIGLGFDVIDYDTDGADESEIGSVRQSDGSVADALIGSGFVEKLGVEILDEDEEELADAE